MQESPSVKDFFISYNRADRVWAEWIAWELEAGGHSVAIQAWDFRPGSNFVVQMDRVAKEAERTIAVLSPDYLESAFAQAEWAASFAADPTGAEGRLLPVRVRECELSGLLRAVIYIDLVGQEEGQARAALLAGIPRVRAKPSTAPRFPGTAAERRADGPRFPGTLPLLRNVPPRSPFFTGRAELLEQVRAQLTERGRTSLCGLGGIGKTQTAVEYAFRYGSDYSTILWTRADSEEALNAGLVEIARLLDLPASQEPDQRQIVAALRSWLESHDRWLLILDNADVPELLDPFLPHHAVGHILLTSRAQLFDVLDIPDPIPLTEMTPAEGELLLLRRAGRLEPEPEERAAVTELAQELGYLPLALEQAGAYIKAKRPRFQEYLRSFHTHRLKLLQRQGPVAGDYPESVATTWSLNFRDVEAASPAAADLLRVSAFLSPDRIPVELLSRGAGHCGPAMADLSNDDPLLLHETLAEAERYSLIRRDDETNSYSIHRLVQAVLQSGMSEETQRLWAERAICAVRHAFPAPEFRNWAVCGPLLPQVRACADLVKQWKPALPEASALLDDGATYLRNRGQFANAYRLYRRAWAARQHNPHTNQLDRATSLNYLAILFRREGEYGKAEPLFSEALSIREQTLGPDDPQVAAVLNGLANLYYHRRQYAKAEPLHRRALAIWERALGPQHPQVAISLCNLANVLRDLEQYAEAEPLYLRALQIRETKLGPDDPAVAETLSNLGIFYVRQGNHQEAEARYQRALAITEKTLGPEHPHAAIILNNLAEAQAHHDPVAAEATYQRALVICNLPHGVCCLDRAETLHGLAQLLRKQHRPVEAEPLARESLAIRVEELGPEAPESVETRALLAAIQAAVNDKP